MLKRIVGGVVLAVAGVVPLALPPTVAGADTPMAVTPYSGFNPVLTRAPYVTDLTQTSVYVNWATTNTNPVAGGANIFGSVQLALMNGTSCPVSTTWSAFCRHRPLDAAGGDQPDVHPRQPDRDPVQRDGSFLDHQRVPELGAGQRSESRHPVLLHRVRHALTGCRRPAAGQQALAALHHAAAGQHRLEPTGRLRPDQRHRRELLQHQRQRRARRPLQHHRCPGQPGPGRAGQRDRELRCELPCLGG